ncbi:MAG: efflux RND transporter periplasmic adaptor subunit [Halioglobus sp.]|nr:efflux RND transporter periplasmic adaptor subunit [Halioglobus sp.]MCB1729062.1 efflux RND transporter periplasmic adaptor subunit [Halieaceae bacterium]
MIQILKEIAAARSVLLCAVTVLLVCQAWRVVAADDHDHHDGVHAGQDGAQEEGLVRISRAVADQSGIGVATAGPATLEIVTQAYGRLVIPPDREAHIHARFPGLVKDIRVHVGERVTRGDVLAVIESNQSLRDYTVKASMSGIVTKRQLNLGELTDDEPLVVIVDDDWLWAELQIFPHQRGAVEQGQVVHLVREQRELRSVITHIAPSDNNAPYMLARVTVDNTGRQFTPGEMVRADIVLESVEVPIAVENQALQTMEGQQVIFIREGDTYERRVPRLGRTDGYATEILDGLEIGETYVTDNSYLIKADIEKAGAEHHH